MPHTKWNRFTNDELIRLALNQPKLTALEVELIQRLSELDDYIGELVGEQMELPLQ